MILNRSKKHIKVLYLDDEENNLRSFKAAFRRDYDIYTANNSEEAYEIIKSVKPHVIFSDQRMPVTTGVDFFNAVRQIFPDPVRILITGYTDINDIIDAINKGHIYRYITKPWSEHEIRVAIDNAYDLYQTRKRLEDKIAELEKTNHELSRFIYSASHELRAPLASALGLIRVAEGKVSDPEGQYFIGQIQKSVNELDILLHNIIDYYKNGRNTTELTDVSFEDILDEVIERVKSSMGKADAHIDCDIRQENKFVADQFRLRIILSNLISNAIKFKRSDQPQARIKITIRADLEKALIKVDDEGVGIMDEHIHKIFHIFFKPDSGHTGAGLGLYIVKEALDRMEGKIEVHSTPGQGTGFSIEIPNKL